MLLEKVGEIPTKKGEQLGVEEKVVLQEVLLSFVGVEVSEDVDGGHADRVSGLVEDLNQVVEGDFGGVVGRVVDALLDELIRVHVERLLLLFLWGYYGTKSVIQEITIRIYLDAPVNITIL